MALSSAAAVRRALIFDGHEKLAWWAGGGEQRSLRARSWARRCPVCHQRVAQSDARARSGSCIGPAAMSNITNITNSTNSTNSTTTGGGNPDAVNSYLYGVLAALAGSTLQVCDFGRASERREAILCVVGARTKQSHGVDGMQAFGLQLWKLHFLILDRAAEAKYQKKLERRYPVFHFRHGTSRVPIFVHVCVRVCAQRHARSKL